MSGLLIAGTSSDAGKSLVVTGICRALWRRGIDVAPFKAQNMSNNSMVCADGSEIGRAQYLQAQAAKVTPSSLLNPVLLKPGSDRLYFVVLLGRPSGTLEAVDYATGRGQLAAAAHAAYRELAGRHELVVVEGAGSPAEINLRRGDYVNMGLARQFDLPVVVIGDIDRGGVLASLYGTWGLLAPADRALLAGFVINKFRGDRAILDPGLAELTARTGLACLGVLPWLRGVWLDGEDTLQVDRWRRELPADPGRAGLRVAVVRFPRISNATDVEALAHTAGVVVELTEDPQVAAEADLVVLPGSRATLTDLAWLRERGLAETIVARHAAGRPVLGICGGYQMLAETIDDRVETGQGRVTGLGVLPVAVCFDAEKVTRQAIREWGGHRVAGYEIHHGRCTPTGPAEPFLDGWRVGSSFGTMLHGSLENDGFRTAWLASIAGLAASRWRPDPAAAGYGAAREQMIETLADAVERHLDLDQLVRLALAGRGPAATADGAATERPGRPPAADAATGQPAGEHAGPAGEATAPGARESRIQPRLIVYTGHGKGKSTAAFGLGLRGWAQGWSIGVYQFIKAAKWPVGERRAYRALDEWHRRTGLGGPIEWQALGAGRTATRAGQRADQRELAVAGWAQVRADLAAGRYDLYLLDELNHVLARGWLDLAEVVETLRRRPGDQHVVVTGRNAPAELIAIADLVSEVVKVRHPFDRGVKGQPGIEW